jgi:hypothetical protein
VTRARASLLLRAAVVVAALLAVLPAMRPALALDRNFAGSAQVDYHLVPTARAANSRREGFDGFTVEAAAKVAVDVSDRFSANLKICFGCHGFEADMAYFDYRVSDALAVRFGRFSPSFGAFNLRHDPANHRLSDKPLPYDMGRMLRLRSWNMGVLPSPFPDNGVEVGGKIALGPFASLDYAAHVVSGFKADRLSGDLDFAQSRDGSLYYVDNNGRPAVGGRAAITADLGGLAEMTAGLSVMRGTFDPDNDLSYTIAGADLSLRVDRTNIRLEYLARRQDLDVSDPTRFRYEVGARGDFAVKHGAYAEVEHPLSATVDLLFRADGMMRVGNVLAQPAGAAPPAEGELSSRSLVGRLTVGAAVSLDRSLRLKLSTELWEFSDRNAAGQLTAVSAHVGAVGTF